MWNVWETGELHSGSWWEDVRGKEISWKDLGVDGRIILRWIFSKWGGGGGHAIDLSGSG